MSGPYKAEQGRVRYVVVGPGQQVANVSLTKETAQILADQLNAAYAAGKAAAEHPDAVRRLVEAAAALVRFFDSVRPGGRVLASDPDIDVCRAALADLGVSIDRTDIGGTR